MTVPIAVVGLGLMGRGIAARLLKQCCHVVSVEVGPLRYLVREPHQTR
jgi:3-hydroxyisobutyrate dehydrogenase-like beta-hydroxyacid dehydrogenase